MCSTSTPRRRIHGGRSCASTKSPTQLRRSAPADPGRAGKACALRLRVQAQRHRQPVRLLDAQRCWRKIKVTKRRSAEDFAHCMRVTLPISNAERIRVVLDNVSTHSPAALYQALPPSEARRMLRRLEFHYTPKHASYMPDF
ncbi:transposase [Mesorhizobium sp.]|nr:transposase [Mesorhizobium sp.]